MNPTFDPKGSSLRLTAARIALLAVTDDARRAKARVILRSIRYDPRKRDADAWLLLLLAFLVTGLSGLARRMSRGEVTIAEWESRSADLISGGYLAAAAIGRNGQFDGVPPVEPPDDPFARLARRDEALLEGEVRYALDRLERFARTLEAGNSVTTSEDAAVARASLYGRYARSIYESTRQRDAADRGLKLERNVLTPGENCRECVEATRRGWVPIGTLPKIGTRICGSNCRCRLAFS